MSTKHLHNLKLPDTNASHFLWVKPGSDLSADRVLTILTGDADVTLDLTGGGLGTVTSVNVSGGTTGLTTSGGPITGSGTITIGGTLAVASGGTGATSAANARTNLGLAIGSDVQAYDAELAGIASLTSAADQLPYFTGPAGSSALTTFTSAGRALLDDANAAAQRATLGLVIGTDVQAYDIELSGIAGLTSASDRLPYFSGPAGSSALAVFTGAGRNLLDDPDPAAQRATLNLGTAAIKNTGTSGDNVPLLNGTNTWSGVQSFANQGIKLASDGDPNYSLTFKEYETMTGNYTLSISVLNMNRAITLGGNFTTGVGGASCTGTNTGDVSQATQAEMEAATSTTTTVSPGRAQYHPGVAKGWVNFDASSTTPTIQASYNVSSLTDAGTGNTTVNWTTAFSAADTYSLVGSCGLSGNRYLVDLGAKASNSATVAKCITFLYSTGALTDVTIACLVAFGDQ